MSDQAKATLVIDGDTEQIAKKGSDAFEKVGKSASNAFTQMLGKLSSGVLLANAIKEAIAEGAAEYSKLVADAKQIGEGALKSRVGQSQTAARLGLGSWLPASIATASGATTEDQRASFAASLSADNGADVNRKAIRLNEEGAFTDAEINKAIKEGRIDELIAGSSKRRSDLGPDFKQTVSLADAERRQIEAKREIAKAAQLGQSEYEKYQDRAALENPGLAGFARGAPNINEALTRLAMAIEGRGKLNMSGVQDSQ